MKVSYQHANPYDGRESTLVRFRDDIREQTTCVLIDAGEGVDLDACLGEDEYLSAILLTHAHLDHVRTLGENCQDGAPIYATAETIRTLTAELDSAGDHRNLGNDEELRSAFEPISDWTSITSDVRVHPVPAGHAPGACGFVLQFADGDDRYHMLATGDFTTRRIAGYPGIPTDLSVDAVFLTAATAPDFRVECTEAVSRALTRAAAGSTVLATASGSTGVHLAYLLAHLCERLDSSPPVTLVGRVATLWEAFEYEHSAVDAVRTFDDPSTVLAPGGVTIAGPEVPVSGSSERLFGRIETDEGATLVQVTSGAFDPVQSGGCTVDHYELRNHPTEETVDALVEDLGPVHVVVTHQHGAAADRYKDKYDSFVWATDDRSHYTLYEDGAWTGPPWVTEAMRRRVRSRLYRADGRTPVATVDTGDVPLPAVERHAEVDLAAEGIDVDHLAEELGSDPAVLSSPPADDAPGKPTDADALSTDTSSHAASADGHSETASGHTTDASESGTVAETELQEICERLERIEAAVTGTVTNATVVDAGEDCTLLRVADDSLANALSHAQTVAVTVHDDAPAESPSPELQDEAGPNHRE